MKTFSFVLGCLLFVQMEQSGIASEIPKPKSCERVGRILTSADPSISAFSELCAGSTLIVSDRTLISCFGQANHQWLQSGRYSIDKVCRRNRSARSACWFVDCERSPNRIGLLNPRSSTILRVPSLEWTSVEGATFYEIRVLSHTGRSFQAKTEDTQYILPETYQFEAGESYEIKIFATTENEILTEGIFSVRIPGDEEVQELENTLNQIGNSNIPDVDKVQLVDASYLSHGLIENSISYLEQEFTKTNNIKVASLLADRYAEIKNPLKAKKFYEIVARERPETSEDFKFAKTMLSRIAALDTPRANFP